MESEGCKIEAESIESNKDKKDDEKKENINLVTVDPKDVKDEISNSPGSNINMFEQVIE